MVFIPYEGKGSSESLPFANDKQLTKCCISGLVKCSCLWKTSLPPEGVPGVWGAHTCTSQEASWGTDVIATSLRGRHWLSELSLQLTVLRKVRPAFGALLVPIVPLCLTFSSMNAHLPPSSPSSALSAGAFSLGLM